MMKICYSTLGCLERPLNEILELSKRYSISGLEIRGIGGIIKNAEIAELTEENATNTKRRMAEAGVAPIVLGTSASFHDSSKYAAMLEEGETSVRIAERMGIPYIRVFGNKLTEDRAECIKRVSDGIGALCDYAEPRGVTVLLEVHGDFPTVETLLPIAEALNHRPNFGLIWDIAHTHKAYGTGFEAFYSALKPYIRHIHVKDSRDSDGALVLPGAGDIPILPILRLLAENGYDGYVSLEWEKHWHPTLPEIETALDAFLLLFQALRDEEQRL